MLSVSALTPPKCQEREIMPQLRARFPERKELAHAV